MRVRLDHVTHLYHASDETTPVRVLEDVSMEIPSGEFAVLRGASGSGKSTLLNLIGAIDRPTSGLVMLGERETSSLSEAELTEMRRRSIGFVFQFFNLVPALTVFENVALPLSLLRISKEETRTRSMTALRDVGLDARLRHYPNELSGGEMQRVAIARAVVHRPQLILADEPTGNLDSNNGRVILDLLRSIHLSTKATVVMATHSDRAAAIGTMTIDVADGRVREAEPAS